MCDRNLAKIHLIDNRAAASLALSGFAQDRVSLVQAKHTKAEVNKALESVFSVRF